MEFIIYCFDPCFSETRTWTYSGIAGNFWATAFQSLSGFLARCDDEGLSRNQVISRFLEFSKATMMYI